MNNPIKAAGIVCLFVYLAILMNACASPPGSVPTAIQHNLPPSSSPPPASSAAIPALTSASPAAPQPAVTAQPFPQDELLWNFVLGEGEQGTWCEGPYGKGISWASDLILQTAQEYAIPDFNATGQYSVEYSIEGHGVGFPEGADLIYNVNQNTFCMQADGYIPPGEYAIQYFIDADVSNPIDFPDVEGDSKYLLMRVLPRVNLSDPSREIAALVSGGIALLDPEQPAYSQLTNGGDPVGPSWSPNGIIIGYFSHLSDGIHMMFADGSADIQIAESAYDLAWSPDNRRLVFSTFGPEIWAANPDGSAGVFLAEGERPQWSPTAAEIAYLRNGELWLMNADGTSQRKLAGDVNFGIRIPGQNADKDFAWSPDGTKIAFIDRSGELLAANLDGSPALRLGSTVPFAHSANRIGNKPAWSPDGNRIALNCDGLCIADLNGGIQKAVDLNDINSLVWSSNGSSVYLSVWNYGIYRYDVSSGSTLPVLVSDFREFSDLSLRPDL